MCEFHERFENTVSEHFWSGGLHLSVSVILCTINMHDQKFFNLFLEYLGTMCSMTFHLRY